jgi:hypothetical protein
VGASFIAAAALPLFAITPLAQADAGHGGAAAADQARVVNHLRSIARAQGPQAQPAQQGRPQAAKAAPAKAVHPAAKAAPARAGQPAKAAPARAARPAAKAAPAKAANRPAAKGHAPAAHQQQPGSKAHQKVYVCHATNSDTNPYVVIWVSVASTQFQGHLMHQNEPNKFWKHDTMWNGVTRKAGTPKPDFIGAVGGSKADMTFCNAGGTTPTPTPTTTTTTPSTTTTTPSTTTTTTGNTPGTTVSGTKTTAPGQTKTPPGQTITPPGQTKTNPPAQVLPTKFTNSPNPNSSANAGTNTQVLGEKVSALPRTGADMVGAALLSLLMLTIGGLLLRLSAVRRRRTH